MKLNFRKIASVLSSAVMVSSTVALAAAATYPAPFVQSGKGMVGVVFGSSAGGLLDSAAATDIAQSLSDQITSSGSTGTTTVTGEAFSIEKTNNKFNLGDTASDIYSNIDDGETRDGKGLPTVLADGEYSNDNNDYEYTQEIFLSDDLTLDWIEEDTTDENPVPFVGMDLTDKPIFNYTLDFDDGVDADDSDEAGNDWLALEDTEINLLGRVYYVADASISDKSITLMDTANAVTLKEGESTSVTTPDGTSYEILLSTVNDGGTSEDDIALTVDGKTYNNLRPGSVKKLATGVYLSVTDSVYSEKKDSYARFSIGTGKIVLANNEEVLINEETVGELYDDAVLKAYITNSSATEIETITLEWTAGDETFVKPGEELLLPGFESVKLLLGSFVVPDYEKTEILPDTDSVKISTEFADGDATFNIARTNGTHFLGLGKSTTKELVTSKNTQVTVDGTDDWFVGSYYSGDEAESYLFTVTDIQNQTDVTDNYINIKSVNDATTTKLTVGDSTDWGNVELTLISASEDLDQAVINITSTNGQFDTVFTKQGLEITLPYFSAGGTGAPAQDVQEGVYNITSGYPTLLLLNMQEQSKDGDFNDATYGAKFNVTIGMDADGDGQVTATSAERFDEEEDSDIEVGYVISDMATKVEIDTAGDPDTFTLYYGAGQSYGELSIAESGAVVAGGSTDTGKVIPVYDTELSKVTGKNLIVVGGACVNTLAAKLLGSATPLCGAAWEAKTKVGAGSFLIQTFAQDDGKVATLVAGYELADTVNAVKALKTDKTIDISAGKAYIGNVNTVQAVTIA